MYEELKKLKKVLVNDSFKFIIIEYGNYSVISEVKEFLASTFPQKKQIEFSSEIKSYNQLINGIKELDNGFVLINDFESYLDNENIYSGLNQKRDSLSQFKIALICFVHIASEEQVLKKCHINIPDLWEFRNLILKIEGKPSIHHNLFLEQFGNNYSSLGGSSIESKQEEIAEIELKLSNLAEIPENYPLIINLNFQIVKILESIHDYPKALEYALKAKCVMERTLNHDHPELASLYNNIGLIYQNLGEFNEGLDYVLRAKEILEKQVVDSDLAIVLGNLSSIYLNLNDLPKALDYGLEAKEIFENDLTPDPLDLVKAYSNLGIIYNILGNLSLTLEYSLKALHIVETLKDRNLFDLATRYGYLANTYQSIGDLQKALEYALKSKSIRESLHEENHQVLSISYFNLGTIYFAMMHYKESYAYFKKAKEILEANFPQGHPNLVITNEWLTEVEKHFN